jgi:hypothetical protein
MPAMVDLKRWSLAIVVGLLAVSIHNRSAARAQSAAFPPRLDQYLTNSIRVTADERKQLLAGAPVTRVLETDPSKEVTVFGAIWIAAPPARYVAALKDIEQFERGGGFRVTKRISDPARLDDFAALALPEEDVADLKACRVGSCEIKLSHQALERVRKQIDWSKPTAKADVEALARQLAVEYVNAYREGGNDRLAVFRDGDRPTFVSQEFRSMIDSAPMLSEFVPDMKRFLLEYPKVTVPGTTSFFYWQDVEFGLKPTIRVNHVAIQDHPSGTVVASKLIYASHYFWTALELRVLVPDPARGPGFWFVNVNRSRSDGLSGFVGRIIRGKVRSGARDGMDAGLKAAKKAIERQGGG